MTTRRAPGRATPYARLRGGRRRVARHDARSCSAHVLGVPRGPARRSSTTSTPAQAAEYDALVARRAAARAAAAPHRRRRLPLPRARRSGRVSSCRGPRPRCRRLGGRRGQAAVAAGTTAPVVVDLCTGSGAIALGDRHRGADARGARRRARRGAPTPGRPQPGRHRRRPAAGRRRGRLRRPRPAPSTWWSATRRTSRTSLGVGGARGARPRPGWRCARPATGSTRSGVVERPGGAAAAARGPGRRRARRRPGRVGAGRVQRAPGGGSRCATTADLAGRARFLTARLAR